jgi:histidinol-phosphatase (PHP family)
MHTPLCNHATGEPEEYAAVAEQRGLKGIIVTCHNPLDMEWARPMRMSVAQFGEYVAIVDRARQAWEGRVDVRLGIESDYAPGMESMLEKFHASAEFNHVLGSVHPQFKDYKAIYYKNDVIAFQRTYFEHLAMAAETKLFDTISHPDLVKNCFPTRWTLELIMPDIQRTLDRIAKTGVAMELNTSGLNKDFPEMNPGRQILEQIKQRNIPMVIGADAHKPKRVAAEYEQALDLLADVGFTHVNVFLKRKRTEIPINVARASLKTPQA